MGRIEKEKEVNFLFSFQEQYQRYHRGIGRRNASTWRTSWKVSDDDLVIRFQGDLEMDRFRSHI